MNAIHNHEFYYYEWVHNIALINVNIDWSEVYSLNNNCDHLLITIIL